MCKGACQGTVDPPRVALERVEHGARLSLVTVADERLDEVERAGPHAGRRGEPVERATALRCTEHVGRCSDVAEPELEQPERTVRRRVETGLLGQRDTLGDAASALVLPPLECVAPGNVTEGLASLGQPAKPACELQLLGRRSFGRIEPASRELDAEQARKREPQVPRAPSIRASRAAAVAICRAANCRAP